MVEIEGLTHIEISSIASQVDERIDKTKSLYPAVVDTFALFVLALIHQEAEFYKLRQAESTSRLALEHTLDHIGQALQKSLDATGPGQGE